jgi:hypothetical protein
VVLRAFSGIAIGPKGSPSLEITETRFWKQNQSSFAKKVERESWRLN